VEISSYFKVQLRKPTQDKEIAIKVVTKGSIKKIKIWKMVMVQMIHIMTSQIFNVDRIIHLLYEFGDKIAQFSFVGLFLGQHMTTEMGMAMRQSFA
jgi:hypothetical protein